MRLGFIKTLAASFVLLAAAPASGQRPGGPVDPAAPGPVDPATSARDVVPGEVIVGFDPSASRDDRVRALRRAGVGRRRSLGRPGTHLVEVAPGASTRNAITELKRSPHVVFAEPNGVVRPAAASGHPLLGSLWGLHNTGQVFDGRAGTPGADVAALGGWDVTTGTDVLVAVVDEGVAYDHPDLAPNMWRNPAEAEGAPGIDDDGNGHVDDVFGVDTVEDLDGDGRADGDSDPRDVGGHGTHVAGTIAGRGDDGLGITGVAWRTRIMAVRALGPGGGTNATVAAAFNYAGRMGARVVNASLGGPMASTAVEQAIESHPDTLFVVAAGNDGSDNDLLAKSYPCSYDSPNLICVAATDHQDELASFSNYGASSVDLGAPGTNVLSARPDFGKVIFGDGFEADDFDVTWDRDGVGSPGDVGWSRTARPDGPGSAATDSPGGSYVDGTTDYMDLSMPVPVAGEGGCRVRFDLRYELATNDSFVVYSKFDDGAWRFLGSAAGPRSTGGQFRRVELLLDPDGADARARSVKLSFGLETALPGTADGAYVDDVSIRCVQPEQGSGEYEYLSGTSMATPHVAGAAALLFARNSSLTVAEARDLILTTGDPLASLAGKTATGRRLDVDRLLRDASLGALPAAVETGGASDLTDAHARLGGTIDARGTATRFVFEYGTTLAYGRATPAGDAGTGAVPVAVSSAVTGLAAGRRYHYRLVGIRGGDRYPGEDRTFTTAETAPMSMPAPPATSTPTPTPTSTTDPPPTPAPVPPPPSVSSLPPTSPRDPTSDPAQLMRDSGRMSCVRRARRLRCRFSAEGAERVRGKVRNRRGRVVGRFRGRAGRRIAFRVRGIRRGRYKLIVKFIDAEGNRARVAERLRIR